MCQRISLDDAVRDYSYRWSSGSCSSTGISRNRKTYGIIRA
jgi:hypothetical protein